MPGRCCAHLAPRESLNDDDDDTSAPPSSTRLFLSHKSPCLDVVSCVGAQMPSAVSALMLPATPACTFVNGGASRNIRRGSKIVCGCTTQNSTICAVRVFLVDRVMLNTLRELAARFSFCLQGWGGVNASDCVKSGKKSVLVSYKPSKINLSASFSCKESDGNDNGDVSLPKTFFYHLQHGLEQTFMSSSEKKDLRRQSDLATDDKGGLLSLSGTTNPKRLWASMESVLSPDVTSHPRRGNADGKVPTFHAAMQPSSSASFAAVSALISDSASMGGATVCSLKASTQGDSSPNTENRNSAALGLRGDVCGLAKNNTGVGAMRGQLPVLGIAVLPLSSDNVADDEPAFSPVRSLRKERSTETAVTTTRLSLSSLSPSLPLSPHFSKGVKEADVSNLGSVLNAPEKKKGCRRCCAVGSKAKSFGQSKGGAAATKNLAHGGARGKKKKMPSKQSTSKDVHHAAHKTPEKLNLSSGAHDVLTGDAGGVLELEANTSPLFAIALSLPFVRQGNISDVFQRWVCSSRPSLVLREVAIRNIIKAVLRRLVFLHQQGKAHGSVKATNIFVSAHVAEAMAMYSPKYADAATAASVNAAAGGGGGGASKGCTLAKAVDTSGGGGTDVNDTKCHCGGFSGGDSVSDEGEKEGEGANGEKEGKERQGEEEDALRSLEWTKHVILADGYYAEVEALLMASFAETTGRTGSSSFTRSRSSPLMSVGVPTPSFYVKSASSTSTTFDMNKLHLFTVEELEYIPPPECIMAETHSCNDVVSKRENSSPSMNSTNNTSVSALPFRKTSNTTNPLCPLSPSYDVWMIGMLAIQLADGGFSWWMGRHPRPLPRLRRGRWSLPFASFVQRCACADPTQRPSAEELLKDKWFNTSLPEEHVDVLSSQARPTPRLQAQSSSSSLSHLRRLCRRAFLDIMLDYHEYAEEYVRRRSQSAVNDGLLQGGNVSFTHNTHIKGYFNTIFNGIERPETTPTCLRATKYTTFSFLHNTATPTPKNNNSNSYTGGSSDGSSSSSRRRKNSNHSKSGREDRRFAGSSSDSMSGRSSRTATQSPADVAASATKDTDEEGDNCTATERRSQPFFLGAVGVALEMCDGEGVPNIRDAETELCEGTSSRACGAGGVCARHPHGHFSAPSLESADGHCEKHQELMSELLQAFWNMHRECRLATDVFCVNLMKRMLLDGRTRDSVFPLLAEETLPFFSIPDGDPHAMVVSTFENMSRSTAAAAVAQREGVGAGCGMRRQSEKTPQLTTATETLPTAPADVSPTAFHNYLFCKWCVTTSWALQQERRNGAAEGGEAVANS